MENKKRVGLLTILLAPSLLIVGAENNNGAAGRPLWQEELQGKTEKELAPWQREIRKKRADKERLLREKQEAEKAARRAKEEAEKAAESLKAEQMKEQERVQREMEETEALEKVLEQAFAEAEEQEPESLKERKKMLAEAQAWEKSIKALRFKIGFEDVEALERAAAIIQGSNADQLKRVKAAPLEEPALENLAVQLTNLAIVFGVVAADVAAVKEADMNSKKYLNNLEKYIKTLQKKINEQEVPDLAAEREERAQQEKRFNQQLKSLRETKNRMIVSEQVIDQYNPILLGHPRIENNIRENIEKAIMALGYVKNRPVNAKELKRLKKDLKNKRAENNILVNDIAQAVEELVNMQLRNQ